MATRWWEATLWPPVSMNGHLGICPRRVGCCDLCRHKRWHKRLGSFDEERNYGWPLSMTWRRLHFSMQNAVRFQTSSLTIMNYVIWQTRITHLMKILMVSAVPADALAPAGARASAGTVMTKLGSCTWKVTLISFIDISKGHNKECWSFKLKQCGRKRVNVLTIFGWGPGGGGQIWGITPEPGPLKVKMKVEITFWINDYVSGAQLPTFFHSRVQIWWNNKSFN